MLSYAIATLPVFIAVAVSWLAGPMLRLHGSSLTALRVCILLAGVAAAVAVYWSIRRGRNEAKNLSRPGGHSSELGSLLRSAQQRLGSAQIGKVRSVHNLPVLYVLGAPNAAKTTSILKSGLDPELLAGQVYQDGVVMPTQVANIWYAQEAVLIDAGEMLWRDSSQWDMLVGRTSPGLLRSVFSETLSLRAAVVCISCETFFGADAADAASTLGRNTNATLRRIARRIGRDLPVHVILTKLDRVPGFAEYVANLTSEEAQELLGTITLRADSSEGVYAERASAIVSSVLDKLFFSLGQFRLEMLGRETVPAHTPFIYQFPRELQKLRSKLSAYLVELARPSHLHANPVLHGFYGIGVRAEILEEFLSAPSPARRQTRMDNDATQIFAPHKFEGGTAVAESQLVSRKVAQWCFLPRLLPEILLSGKHRNPDQAPSARVSMLRRLALGGLCVALVILIGCFTVSYRNNLRLEQSIQSAAMALPSSGENQQALADVSQLSALDSLRRVLLKLEDYDRSGAPLMCRWGLYRGAALLPPARKLYFDRFRRLLLASTQSNLARALEKFPDSAPSDADYLAAYNPLRAYLISTSYPEHSNRDFLSPVLLRYWLNEQRASIEQQQLALKQFRFYADELRVARLYSISPVEPAIVHARQYLNSFGDFKRLYQKMLAAANLAHPAIDFNRLFPGSAATVVEPHIVPGAFSRSGAAFMQNAIAHPERYFTGESWVLGRQAPLTVSAEKLSQKAAQQYASDFVAQWLKYLRSASVVRYRGLGDAQEKLQKLAGPNSALLALVATASRHTAVASQDLSHRFQPVQAVVPADLKDRLIAPGNQAYMSGLTNLQSAISQFTQDPAAPSNSASAQPVIAAAVSAHSSVSQTAQSFNIDPIAHVEQTVIKLLQQPIAGVEEAIRRAAPSQVNAAGRAFCGRFTPLLSKFPFDRNAKAEATPAEVAEALRPGSGLLWQFYEANLKPLLVQQGDRWTVSAGITPKPTPDFVEFFNRAADLSNALFSNGASLPTLTFNTRILRSPGIQSVTLAVDSQRLAGSDVSRQFTWSAQSAQTAKLVASYGSNDLPLQFSGPWSIFHLVDHGRVEQADSRVRLAYPLEISGTPIVVNGIPLTERLELSGPGARILAPRSLAGLHCVSQVAH